eukprot:scaffold2788_cov69-Phaeocystis_antarctica.AAC.10
MPGKPRLLVAASSPPNTTCEAATPTCLAMASRSGSSGVASFSSSSWMAARRARPAGSSALADSWPSSGRSPWRQLHSGTLASFPPSPSSKLAIQPKLKGSAAPMRPVQWPRTPLWRVHRHRRRHLHLMRPHSAAVSSSGAEWRRVVQPRAGLQRAEERAEEPKPRRRTRVQARPHRIQRERGQPLAPPARDCQQRRRCGRRPTRRGRQRTGGAVLGG